MKPIEWKHTPTGSTAYFGPYEILISKGSRGWTWTTKIATRSDVLESGTRAHRDEAQVWAERGLRLVIEGLARDAGVLREGGPVHEPPPIATVNAFHRAVANYVANEMGFDRPAIERLILKALPGAIATYLGGMTEFAENQVRTSVRAAVLDRVKLLTTVVDLVRVALLAHEKKV